MVHVKEEELPVSQDSTQSRALTPPQTRSFQQSIGLMLASYTRAINKRNNWSGSLFRKQTKAICLSCSNNNARAWFDLQGITVINIQHSEMQYPNICFNYINLNPVKDRLVKQCEAWEFSSYADIKGLRNGKLINREKINELGLLLQ
jgi:putative transposase